MEVLSKNQIREWTHLITTVCWDRPIWSSIVLWQDCKGSKVIMFILNFIYLSFWTTATCISPPSLSELLVPYVLTSFPQAWITKECQQEIGLLYKQSEARVSIVNIDTLASINHVFTSCISHLPFMPASCWFHYLYIFSAIQSIMSCWLPGLPDCPN